MIFTLQLFCLYRLAFVTIEVMVFAIYNNRRKCYNGACSYFMKLSELDDRFKRLLMTTDIAIERKDKIYERS